MSTQEHATSGGYWKAGLAGAGLVALCVFVSRLPYERENSLYQPVTHVINVALTVGIAFGVLLIAWAIGFGIYSTTRTAERRRILHAPGWANRHSIIDHLGIRAAKREGKQTRPSLATRAGRNGYKPKPTDYGQWLGKAVSGFRPARGSQIYADWQKSLLFVAPQGSGKTALMLHSLIDAPGGALAASTKPDIYTLTAELRAEQGPVLLFNPQNVAGLDGNFGWDPLTGCEHYQVAQDRATALVRGTKAITAMTEQSWAEKCIEIVSKYLMAARLKGYDLRAVAYWLSHPEDESAVRILQQNPQHVPGGWAESLAAELRSSADRMKGSIWSLARASVAFMSNPLIAAATTRTNDLFDVKDFIRARGTLYLLGDSSDETIAPLLAALTDYIYRGFRELAQSEPDSRLDPPFGFFLDEVTKITPVPLAEWAADIRAHGGYIVAVCQALAQLEERWGKEGLAMIKGLFSKVILPGIQDQQVLEELSKLVGPRWVKAKSHGRTTSSSGTSSSENESDRKEEIMPPEQIRMLPPRHALILIRESKAVVTKFTLGQVRAKKMLAKLHAEKAKKRAAASAQTDVRVAA